MRTISADRITVEGLAAALVATMERLRIYCGKCWAEARFDPHRKSGLDPAVREIGAHHFHRNGWRFDGKPLCPRCAKEMSSHR
jgi:ribosomal protein S27AE